MNNKLVIVTGMHRSGTSALARVFVDAGFSAGINLIPPDKDNPTGYWEDFDIFNLNNTILSRLFLTWDEVENFDQRRIHLFFGKILDEFSGIALQIIDKKLQTSSGVILKDPRFCILWPFWKVVLEQTGAQVYHFHIIRNPMAVASSLERRNGIHQKNSLALWYFYNLALLTDSSEGALFISYEQLLKAEKTTILAIAGKTGLDPSLINLTSSIDVSINHFENQQKKIILPESTPNEIGELWDLLIKMTESKSVSPDKTLIEKPHSAVPDRQKIAVQNTKITATLVFENESSETLTDTKIPGNQTASDRFIFHAKEHSFNCKKFRIYVNDKPCLIENTVIILKAAGQAITLKPESGNYRLKLEEKYYFTSNLPFFEFQLSMPVDVQNIEFQCKISRINTEEFPLLIAAQNIELSTEIRAHRQTQTQKAQIEEHLNRITAQFDSEKQRFVEQIQSRDADIEALERKALWLYTEFNKAKASLSWKITLPLRYLQQVFNRIENRIHILVNDIGASIRLLQREGLSYFLVRLTWYVRGFRLKEDIEFEKKQSNRLEYKSISTQQNYEALVFNKPVHPRVSIILPVFNNYSMTFRCLESVLKNSGLIDYEIIMIDDCSTERTFNPQEKFTGIQIIRNDKNLGFLRSCNKGAASAAGEYLCFLNNDTEVHPDWLQHLVNLMDENHKIAIAGPKLVYSDGRLQEAGGIIWNDASAWNYGKYDDAEKPDYNYQKEVDYISGACMLVRKKVWDKLGGFDEQFAPAYYEDTDLAMRVGKLGLKVYYQPLSVVTHHEGLSNGFNDTSGIKRFQTINRQKFLQKWEHELKIGCSPNGNNVFFHRDRSLRQKHLLVIDHYVPMYDQDAGSRSTFSYLKLFLKMGFRIHFIGDNYFKHEPYTTILQQMGIEVLYGNYYQKNIRDWFRDNGQYISFVFAHRMHIAPKYFGMIRKFTTAKIGYVGHDLQFMGSQRKYELTGEPEFRKESKKFKETETAIFRTVDYIFPFSTYEAPFIQEIAPDKVVKTLPVYFYHNIREKVNGFDKRRDILFIGYFGHPPNPDAILWFTREVFPRVKNLIPDVRLNIVGSQPTEEVKRLEDDSIKVTGYVSDEKLLEYGNIIHPKGRN